jgi:iron complex outermembrane receptor protein
MNRGLLCGASVLTVAFFTTALASSAQAAAAPAATPGASEVGEVVVTAEKRSTKLEKTPVAVTALTSQMRDLQGIQSITDMTNVTPGLTYSTLANRPYMRGVGRQTDALATDGAVAVYNDGVYTGSNANNLIQLDTLWVDRIDVQRGPQSTLFGRNSDGGSMNYISKKPTNEFEAEGRVGVDDHDMYWGEAAVSGPITDSLKFRVGGGYWDQTGGYFKNLNGQSSSGAIFQGGNGWKYHADGQVQGNIGDQLDFGARAFSSGGVASYYNTVLEGPWLQSEFYGTASGNYAAGTQFQMGVSSPTYNLIPDPLYALCAPGLNPNGVGCTGVTTPGIGTTPPGTNPSTLVSVVMAPGAPITNPNLTNAHTFSNGVNGSSKVSNDINLSWNATWHLPGVDIKYVGGYTSFDYNLKIPSGSSPDITSFTLAGPSTASAGCTAYATLLGQANNSACTQNLTLYPSNQYTEFDEHDKSYSNEINFSSTGSGPLQWIAGAYQYHEHFYQPVLIFDAADPQWANPAYANFANGGVTAAPANTQGCFICENITMDADDYAGFGQVDWQVDSAWKLTGGVRYTYDHKYGYEAYRIMELGATTLGGTWMASGYGANTPAMDITGIAVGCSIYEPLPAGASPIPGACSTTSSTTLWAGTSNPGLNTTTGYYMRNLSGAWGAFTGTAGVTWTPDNNTMAYLRYSRGYKTGGFNYGNVQPSPETQPEYVDSYEFGLKEVFSHALTTNVAIFYYNYTGLQVPLTIVPAVGANYAPLFNIPTTREYGAELEATWRPIDPLVVNFNYAYLNTRVMNMGGCFVDSLDPFAQMPGAKTSGCAAGVVGSTGRISSSGQNLAGASLPAAVPNKISLNASYTFKFEPGNLSLNAAYLWRDTSYSSLFNRAYTRIPSYAEVNVAAAWNDAKDRYTAKIFVNNIFNTQAADTAGGVLLSATPYAPPVVEKTLGLIAPVTYGVEFQYRFR